MNISGSFAAPLLLIAAMLILILFQSVFFTDGGVRYPEEPQGDASLDLTAADYISLNGVKYRPDGFFMLAVASNICAFLLTGAFYVKLRGAGHSKKLKLGLPKLKYLPLFLYMLLVLTAGTVLINALLVYFGAADSKVSEVLPFVFYTGGNTAYDMGVLICFVVLPAVCEEFFFRSVIAAEYERYGAFCACVCTALAFALSHFSLKFFPSYLFAAAAFYILAKITNSVLFAVFLHAGYNFFCIYLADKFLGALNFEQNRLMFIFVAAILFIISVFLALNILEGIYSKKAYGNPLPPPLVFAGG
ncbi:MAG: CPBP family glutamic-type intramembrane protease, partial [Oscillospiraceae bacterium]|nr:CPBP family glutamic-type intramembrane protease [Oscillospiraceae bacterium]